MRGGPSNAQSMTTMRPLSLQVRDGLGAAADEVQVGHRVLVEHAQRLDRPLGRDVDVAAVAAGRGGDEEHALAGDPRRQPRRRSRRRPWPWSSGGYRRTDGMLRRIRFSATAARGAHRPVDARAADDLQRVVRAGLDRRGDALQRARDRVREAVELDRDRRDLVAEHAGGAARRRSGRRRSRAGRSRCPGSRCRASARRPRRRAARAAGSPRSRRWATAWRPRRGRRRRCRPG